VVHSGTTVLQNAYDGDGRRIKKTESDSIVFMYQGLNALFEKDLTTGVITKRFYANGLQVAKMVGSTTTYLHEDHLGSIRFVSSSTGSQVFSSNYVPCGRSSSFWNSCQYCGTACGPCIVGSPGSTRAASNHSGWSFGRGRGIAGDYFGVPVVHAMRGALVGAAASGGVDLIPNLISNGPGLQAYLYYAGGSHAE